MTYRVLFVDDEEHVLAGLKHGLRKQPYEILTCQSPREAIRMLETSSIDVLVSDENMGKMSGTELCEHARSVRPSVIRILLTGTTEARRMLEAVNSGLVFRFLSKPLGALELAIAIRDALLLRSLLTSGASVMNLVEEQLILFERLLVKNPGLRAALPPVLGTPVSAVEPNNVQALARRMEDWLAASRKLTGQDLDDDT